jgi:hypothetical protein
MATEILAGGRTVLVYIFPVEVRHTGSEVRQASYRMWIRALSQELQRSGGEVYVPQSSAKLKNF